jgi:hypothetical protein
MVDLLQVGEEIQDSVGVSVQVSLHAADLMRAVVFRFDGPEGRWSRAVPLAVLGMIVIGAEEMAAHICEEYRAAMVDHTEPPPSVLDAVCPVPPFPGIRGADDD